MRPNPKHQMGLDNFLAFRLSVASNEVNSVIARAYERRFGLSIPDWRLIAVLAIEPLTQKELVNRIFMDKVTVSRAAQRLIDRGLVKRLPKDGDKRSHVLALTTAAWGIHAEIAPLARAYETKIVSAMTAKELKTLRDILGRVEKAADALIEAMPKRGGD